MTRVLLTLTVLTVGTVLGVTFTFRTSPWPKITDPAALRREASVLCARAGGWHELVPAGYPPAMTKLRPASISVSGERVYIGLVPTPGSARFHGYYVWPDTTVRADSGIVREESIGTPAS